MGKLLVLVGLPRSGKSTRTKFYEKKGYIVICADEIRREFGHTWKRSLEPVVNLVEQTMVRMLLKNHDVLVDETNTSEFSIRKFLQIDPAAVFEFIDTPVKTCVVRAVENKQEYLMPVINRCHENLERLKKTYGSVEFAIEVIRAEISKCKSKKSSDVVDLSLTTS